MSRKHSVHGTGFAGAKLVAAVNRDAGKLTRREKGVLIDAVAKTLELLAGNVYTGCGAPHAARGRRPVATRDAGRTRCVPAATRRARAPATRLTSSPPAPRSRPTLPAESPRAPVASARLPPPRPRPRLAVRASARADLNTTLADMERLDARSPYVLAALPNLAVCPNSTTAHGVVGAVEAAFGHALRGKRFLVHGCGAVGSVVAAELRDAGAHVLTLDIDLKRAAIDGVEALPADAAWWDVECDAVVPCSASYLIDDEIAGALRARTLVGATNLLFRTPSALETVLKRGILFVPESVSSAGAVIGDSVEHFDREAFVHAAPADMYGFVRATVASKTTELLAAAAALDAPPSSADVRELVSVSTSALGPVGKRFRDWRDEQRRREGFAAMPVYEAPAPSRAVDAGGAAHFGAALHAARRLAVGARALSSRAPAAPHRRSLSSAAAPARQTGSGGVGGGENFDVVIAGAGIMGLNIAYQLKRRAPELSVCVLEKAAGLGHGSSGYSTGFQRAYYSFDETMRFAIDGMAAYKSWRAYTGLADAHETFVKTGALWMLGKPAAENEAMRARLAAFGIESDVLDAAGVRERYPMMSTDPFPEFDAAGDELPLDESKFGNFSAVLERGCGHVDPNACLADLLAVARRDGVHVRFNTPIEAVALSADGSRCVGVRTCDGQSIEAGVVVNAAGPWFGKLMRTAGVSMSTTAVPIRIQVAHKRVPEEYLDLPFVADCWGASGIYFMPRRQSGQLVFGSIDSRFESEVVDDPDACNPALDPDVRQDFVNCLLHRLPGLAASGEVSGFSSM